MKILTLYSDAKASADRYAICDKDGHPAWWGRFFEDDYYYRDEQSSGELSAACKAVWLAGKVGEYLGEKIKLILCVDAEWLCHANRTDGKGGKARRLSSVAKNAGIDLEVRHIPGKNNPADKWTERTVRGYDRHNVSKLAKTVEGGVK